MNLDATGREEVVEVEVEALASICSADGFSLFARSVTLKDKNMT